VVEYCVAQSQAGIDHEADYRALTADGREVWIRDVVHVLRDANGEVEALVGFMFDISERRRNEEKLAALQQELKRLSYQDALTGVANRRRFDEVLETEWGSARRNATPIALIMLDIDHFKQYNDHYGHVRGDEALQQVAEILTTIATRPRDLVCRFGGEEFVLVLPETDTKAAHQLAIKCQDAIRDAAIEHEQGEPSQLLTVSMGVATSIPERDEENANVLIREVDRRLYLAKKRGRDSIVGDAESRKGEGGGQVAGSDG
jgi:diguanylate cyclase (GGDEF)-like protein